MSQNHLKFVYLAVRSYAGIDKDKKAKIEYPLALDKEQLETIDAESGVVIFFPEGYPYIQGEGDQGTGKTSLARALSELGGGEAYPNAINLKDKDKNIKSRFYGRDGGLYDVSITKSGVVLHRIEVDSETGQPALDQKGRVIKAAVSSPKTMLQQLVGPTGISPLTVASYDASKQVQWIRGLYNLDQEVIRTEQEIKQRIDTSYQERTKAGRQYQSLRKSLERNDFYVRMEYWQDALKNIVEYDLVLKESSDIQKRYQDYIKAEPAIENLKNHVVKAKQQRVEANVRIEELMAQIERERQHIATIDEDIQASEKRIEQGEKYLKDNQDVLAEYNAINNRLNDAREGERRKDDFKRMMEEKEQMDHFESEYQRLTYIIDENRKLKKEFIKQFSPDIPEFEVCVPDEDDPREGLFYRDMPLSHLSESQNWEWFTMLCKQLNIQIIIVENISSLGSGSIEKFNEFIEQGAYVFANKMNRSEKELKITFNTKVK